MRYKQKSNSAQIRAEKRERLVFLKKSRLVVSSNFCENPANEDLIKRNFCVWEKDVEPPIRLELTTY